MSATTDLLKEVTRRAWTAPDPDNSNKIRLLNVSEWSHGSYTFTITADGSDPVAEEIPKKDIVISCSEADYNSPLLQEYIKTYSYQFNSVARDEEYKKTHMIPLAGKFQFHTEPPQYECARHAWTNTPCKCLDDSYACEYWLHEEYNSEKDMYEYYALFGYSWDKQDAHFSYDHKNNVVYVPYMYRLCEVNPAEESWDSWEYSSGAEKDPEACPYWRFPRSKDGITIPRFISHVFQKYPGLRIIISDA
jgi:hypothetical protein